MCGGVRGAGAVGDLARGLYSPLPRLATSTSPRSVPPPSDGIYLSLFSHLVYVRLSSSSFSFLSFSVSLSSVSESFSLDAFVCQLPAKVTEQQQHTALRIARPRRYFAFGVHCYHPRPLSFLPGIVGSAVCACACRMTRGVRLTSSSTFAP